MSRCWKCWVLYHYLMGGWKWCYCLTSSCLLLCCEFILKKNICVYAVASSSYHLIVVSRRGYRPNSATKIKTSVINIIMRWWCFWSTCKYREPNKSSFIICSSTPLSSSTKPHGHKTALIWMLKWEGCSVAVSVKKDYKDWVCEACCEACFMVEC